MNNDNVIELPQRDTDAPNRDVLEAMWVGIEMSKWGSLANIATEAANQSPLDYLKMLARYIEQPKD